ncbi:MAG: phage holin family protein [Firmicutes bacterium]|nr:phage holin family protein [Bacillota bacterium]
MEKIFEIINAAAANPMLQLVVLVIVFDTIFGVIRAIKEHKFNSCVGIDGAIRKVSMIISLVFLLIADQIISVNLIAFIPETVRSYIGLDAVGLTGFFSLLYIAYEIVSILKNMTLCGLPVRIIWDKLKAILGKYTAELPDDE